MILLGMAMLAGVLLALQLAVLPPLVLCYCALALAIGLAFVHWLRLLAFVIIGFAWTALFAYAKLDHSLPADLESRTLRVEGRVAGLPERNAQRVRFLFDIHSVEVEDSSTATQYWHRLPLHVRIAWYQNAPNLAVGEKWRLTVRLKRPNGFNNPGGFDYEKWLFGQGVRATGYVYSKGRNERLAAARGYWIDRARATLARHIDLAAADLSHNGVFRALAIGDRSQIDPAQWQQLLATGTNHLFAISGLHIGLIAMLGYYLCAQLWRVSGYLQRHVQKQRFALCISLLLALFYAAMAGFALPTQRALIMLCVPALIFLVRRRIWAGTSFGVALILVLLINPLAPLSAGFWLSFAAVATILYWLGGRLVLPNKIAKIVSLQLVIALGLTPVLLIQFGQVPLASTLANIVAVPLMSLLVVPLTLTASILALLSSTAAGILFTLVAYFIDAFWYYLVFIESIGFLPVVDIAATHLTIASTWLGVMLLLLPRGSSLSLLGILFLVPLLVFSGMRVKQAPGDMDVWVLDVGQGLSVVVRAANRVLVFDTGSRFSARFNAGQAALVPTLREHGIDRVDTLIISHADLDHRGGSQALIDAFPVDNILTSAPQSLGFSAQPCRRGTSWQWGRVNFELLSPADNDGLRSRNNRSCVLRLSSGRAAVLLPGDIEALAESVLLDAGVPLAADILVAPHHGSATSSSATFVRAVDPEHVVYPVGYRNRFRFPSKVVSQRYQALGVSEWSTDRHGAVMFHWSAAEQRWTVETYRQKNRRFWQTTRE